jgi:hypothetical protein
MLQRFVDSAAIAEKIERVRSLSGDALRRRWQSAFGRPPPEHLPRDLSRRMIAARIQEQAFGTLDRARGAQCGLPPRDRAGEVWTTMRSFTTLMRRAAGEQLEPRNM